VDGTGAVALTEIAADLTQRGITLAIAGLHLRRRMLLERAGQSHLNVAAMAQKDFFARGERGDPRFV